MKNEMGGEYWLEDFPQQIGDRTIPTELMLGEDNQLLYSGRTATDFVIQDIKKTKTITTVYMPSYCCFSMIQPFVDQGIKIDFYEIHFEQAVTYKIDMNRSCDIFYAMHYFGFYDEKTQALINHFKSKGSLIIEDITQGLLMDKNHCENSDYLIASLRKWFNVACGGLACKVKGRFSSISLEQPPRELIDIKLRGMRNKAHYLKHGGTSANKASFLQDFETFKQSLKNQYQGLGMDDDSIALLNQVDFQLIKKRRKENSLLIYSTLKDISMIQFLYQLNPEDCPLFVPILLPNPIRNDLVEYLIRYNVYCPKHWAVINDSTYAQGESNIYYQEMSLLCDDRYSTEDIGDYLEIIKIYFQTQKQYDY